MGIPVGNADLGGERFGGKPCGGSENKVPIEAEVFPDNAGHPRYEKLATVATFTFAAIADWAQDSLASGCKVICVVISCIRAEEEVSCSHQPVVTK
jgi:hypothetical protein